MFIVSFIIFLPLFIMLVMVCYIALKSMVVMCNTTTGAMSELIDMKKNNSGGSRSDQQETKKI